MRKAQSEVVVMPEERKGDPLLDNTKQLPEISEDNEGLQLANSSYDASSNMNNSLGIHPEVTLPDFSDDIAQGAYVQNPERFYELEQKRIAELEKTMPGFVSGFTWNKMDEIIEGATLKQAV